jgi:hypothetical protein
LSGSIMFDRVALPIEKRKAVAIESAGPGDGKAGRGIQAPAEKDDSFRHVWPLLWVPAAGPNAQ